MVQVSFFLQPFLILAIFFTGAVSVLLMFPAFLLRFVSAFTHCFKLFLSGYFGDLRCKREM